jgi:hypothetical protein
MLRSCGGLIVERGDYDVVAAAAAPRRSGIPKPLRGRPVNGSVHIRSASSLTRHDFPGSLVGNGEGGGVPTCSRVYMNRLARR